MIRNKYEIVKPEDVRVNTRYTFSFNPEEQPKPQRFYNITLTLFSSWSEKNIELFKSMKYAKIETYMEISKNSRLHYHGYIKILDIVNFYFFEVPKLKHYGTFEIDFISDPMTWDLYCKKQKDEMEKFCNKNNMLYHYVPE